MQNRIQYFQKILKGVIDKHEDLTVGELLDVKVVHSDLEMEVKDKLEPILSEIESSQAEAKDMSEFFQFMNETNAKLEKATQQPEIAPLVKVDRAIHHALEEHGKAADKQLKESYHAASKALANSGLFTRVGFERRLQVAIHAANQSMSSDSEELSTIEEMSTDNTSSRSFGC